MITFDVLSELIKIIRENGPKPDRVVTGIDEQEIWFYWFSKDKKSDGSSVRRVSLVCDNDSLVVSFQGPEVVHGISEIELSDLRNYLDQIKEFLVQS